MNVGAEVEVRVAGVWTPGTITDRYVSPAGTIAKIKLDDGTAMEMSVPEDPNASVVDMRLLSGANMGELDVDDLTSLLELDENSILAALEARFQKQKIYTNTGAILLAVNPFQKLRGLYEKQVMYAYLQSYETRQSNLKGRAMAPHIYQVAGEAYKAMLLGLNGVMSDQSILVSGESGSGKTESTKFLMEYLAQAGDNQAQSLTMSKMGQVGIAAKVLQTNTLLESFGNARTLRNDNSSRFGKFIKLHFTSGGRLTGASIQTYLLEKVRLVSQSIGERNYHIFYEMTSGASPSARERWQLDPPHGEVMATGDVGDVPESARQFLHYRYLNQSQCFKRRDGTEDKEMFQRVVDAMQVVGFTDFERSGIFDLLAALLHIGNLTFEHDENSDRQSTDPTNSSTDLAPNCIWSRDAAATLLTVDANQLEKALSVRKIRAGTDFVSVKLSAEQANNARDALAKALYGRLFDWMVGKVNEFLKMDDSQKAKGGMHFIGILDIFGFEVFPKNSFEQLCINFANETLQQQFNDYVFKMEQLEYESQGVDWKYVEFLDNQDCVNLISQRPTGILPLVDEECLIPKGNDTTFASKLYRAWEGHPRFSASRMQKASGNFTIVHYAGNVEYSSVGFLEKNKDVLHQEAVDLLVYSPQEGSFTRTLCEGIGFRDRAKSSPRQRANASKQRGASVGLQFKEQLTALLETLHTTSPHYVRCLKPNDTHIAGKYDRERVLNQLRCNGVMEAVRVARAGFPIRIPHDEFVGRYFSLKRAKNPLTIKKPGVTTSFGLGDELSQATMLAGEAKELLKDLITILPKEHDAGSAQSSFENSDQAQFSTQCMSVGCQMGISKMFMKKSTYDYLEDMRTQRLRRHMVKIYHAMLCFFARSRYLKLRHAIRSVQLSFRYKKQREQNRRRKLIMIRRKNGRKVQGFVRMVTQRNKYRRFINVVKMLQWRFRYRRMLAVVRLAQKKEQERLQKQKEEQEQEQQHQYQDSYTASDSSSESSMTSNDVEGSTTSSQYSDDYYPSNDTFPMHAN
uniref:Myosin motor domain-containing protein n=1 Tax=Globisporangium ultimum (strain ATCC 200006 / CBS 805.95 / DAOM BR144) TaxID=431595 RepID=K3WAW2_GLOUD